MKMALPFPMKMGLNQGFIGFPGFFLIPTTFSAHHINCILNGKSKYFHASGLLRNASSVFSYFMPDRTAVMGSSRAFLTVEQR
jgi:hypothetical protein